MDTEFANSYRSVSSHNTYRFFFVFSKRILLVIRLYVVIVMDGMVEHL